MSTSHAASTTSTQHPGQGVHAGASATAAPSKTVLVAGQSGESVNVQSQLATSQVATGDVTSKSNISQVIGDLGAHHSTSGAWLDAETAKVSQWGQKEIERVLQQTKALEENLVLAAKEKQKALDASHSGEIAKLVQQLDLRKAAELKELEDGLQRTIQATLSSSKADINRVETEMNNRKMELLKQSQLKSAKEIDALSNLVVETKLVPSQTRTVIETNTETGHVLAVATGGSIATGSAQAESYSSQKIAAVPNAGELKQAADVTVGNMIQDSTGRKVGEGAIVNTQTRVQEQQHGHNGAASDVHVNARPLVADQHRTAVAHPTTGTAVPHHTANTTAGNHTATVVQPATGVHTTGAHHNTTAHPAKTAVVTGVPIASGGHGDAAVSHKQDLRTEIADHQAHPVHQKDSIMAHGHHAGSSHDGDSTGAEPHQHGLLCKVKHALGMKTKGDETAAAQQHAAATSTDNGVAYAKGQTIAGDNRLAKDQAAVVGTEPRSTDATRRVL